MEGWPALVRLAQRQFGLVARDQAAVCGVAASTLDKRATREGWERPHPGVVALPGSVNSWERRVMAGVLATGHGALATGWTAAYLYGLIRSPRLPLTLTIGHAHRAPLLQGVRVVRSRTLWEQDAATIGLLPVVKPVRMIADLATQADLTQQRFLAIDACQKRLLTPVDLTDMALRLDGSRAAGRLTTIALSLMEGQIDSALEWQTRLVLDRDDLPRPEPQPYPVERDGRVLGHVDIAWPQWQVGIECDGYRYHSERGQLDRDSARQNALTAAGWTLLRVTWAQMDREPRRIVAQARDLLRAAGCTC